MDMRVLDQAETWTDKNEVVHPIEGMDGRYALNVYNYLKGKAQVLGFHYGMHLATLGLPPEDSAAYDDVLDAIDREQERIGTDPLGWLKDKPLMRALVARVAFDRISREIAGYIPPVEPLKFPPYPAPDFQPKPFGYDLDEERFGQRPGDETRVFLVKEDDYERSSVLAVFVGNRLAAYKWLGEYNRYEMSADVEEFDDASNATTPGLYAQVRKYREPWTEIGFQTIVNLETGDYEDTWTRKPMVRMDIDPGFDTKREPAGHRGRFNVQIITTGPDTQVPQLRHLHAANVNKIRANVLDDLTKDRP